MNINIEISNMNKHFLSNEINNFVKGWVKAINESKLLPSTWSFNKMLFKASAGNFCKISIFITVLKCSTEELAADINNFISFANSA